MFKTALVGGLALSMTATMAMAFEKQANTPSGRPEMVYAYTPLETAVGQVASGCMDAGWVVTSQSTNQVVCEVPMGIWQSALTQMLIGNSYSTTPKQFVRVSLTQVGDHTRAQTQSWAETQMVFGQVQQQAFNDDATYNNMLGFLAKAGAQFPVGTTFQASAYLGVDGAAGQWQNGRRQTFGWTLTQVVDRAPAQRMGIQVGDIITKVNNRTFRDQQGFANLLDRQRLGEPMTITIMRGGVEQTFTTTAEGRPRIVALVRPGDVPAGELPTAMQMTVALMGSVEAANAALGITPTDPKTGVVEAAAATPQSETELDRMRREAAEAQARLAAAEAAAAGQAVVKDEAPALTPRPS